MSWSAFNQYISEEEKGLKCVWTYNSGDLSESEAAEEAEEEELWNSSRSSFAEERREQEEIKNRPVESEKRVIPKRGLASFYSERDVEIAVNSAVSSALQRARQRHSDGQQAESPGTRRRFVRSSVPSLPQRHFDIPSSSSSSNARTLNQDSC
ncbi:unnamed protein product [Cylindrotheca closterium]|uniref:Uncharacterized protein n=1 Tax=Cylindrotheca closterium TaxID=2856 RepID=A0AAD2JKS7_9STRA|nr:unnamed protein product [Cylindrotheca closterium]